MQRRTRRQTQGVLVAIVMTIVAAGVRAAFDRWLGTRIPLGLFFFAILVTAARGGLWPGLLATVLATLTGTFLFIAPRGSLILEQPGDWISIAFFVAIGAAVSWGFETLLRLEERVEERRSELDVVASRTALLLSRCGRDLRYRFVNRACAEFLGKPPEEIVGRTIPDVIGAAGFRAIQPYIERVLGGEQVEFEIEVPYAHAGPRFVHAHYAPEHDAQGAVDSWVATDSDVSDRKTAEAALRESEERYRSLVSVVTDVPWTADAEGAFVEPQASWEAYTGQRWETHRGFGWLAMIHPADRDRTDAIWRHACETGTTYEGRGRLWNAAARQWRHYVARATPVLNSDGSVREWVGSCTDVDETVRATEALKEADRRKDEFLAILAHELRNPLAPVRNATHYLKSRDLSDPEIRRPVEMIERQVTQMARLIDDLLDVSRITRGVLELRLERLEFSEIADAVVDACRDEIESRGHTLRVALPEETVLLKADRHRLVQVFGNLIVNAAKYTPTGGVIDFTARIEGDQLEVGVQDNGVGIPRAKLSEIFELFAQVDRSLERQSGLGIGLTLARQLVELHRGTIEARSDGIGQGSTFVVRLPIGSVVAVSAETSATDAGVPVKPRRILVADDNEDAAESMAIVLRMSGHEVRVASDGQDALEQAAEFLPEVAFLDIGMPRMNGYDAARRIRQESWGQALRLVAVTGWGQDGDLRRSEEAGFNAHLVKPASPELLVRMLQELENAASHEGTTAR